MENDNSYANPYEKEIAQLEEIVASQARGILKQNEHIEKLEEKLSKSEWQFQRIVAHHRHKERVKSLASDGLIFLKAR